MAFSHIQLGSAIGTKQCVNINGKPVVTTTAAAFNRMKAAASSAGVSLHINSGFRTQKEQEYLYNCYKVKCFVLHLYIVLDQKM